MEKEWSLLSYKIRERNTGIDKLVLRNHIKETHHFQISYNKIMKKKRSSILKYWAVGIGNWC